MKWWDEQASWEVRSPNTSCQGQISPFVYSPWLRMAMLIMRRMRRREIICRFVESVNFIQQCVDRVVFPDAYICVFLCSTCFYVYIYVCSCGLLVFVKNWLQMKKKFLQLQLSLSLKTTDFSKLNEKKYNFQVNIKFAHFWIFILLSLKDIHSKIRVGYF